MVTGKYKVAMYKGKYIVSVHFSTWQSFILPKIFIHWVNFFSAVRKSILVADAFVSTFWKYIFRLLLYSSALKFLYARLSRKMSLDFGRDRQLSHADCTSRYKRVSFFFGVRSSLATYRSTSGAETNGPTPKSFNFSRLLFWHLSIFNSSVSFLVTPVQVSWFC